MARHIRLTGDRRADRETWVQANIEPRLSARCHQRLRGPYTGVDEILAPVLRDAIRRWPDLVEKHRFELLYGMPELEQIIGPAPRTLASDASFRERTRFFASDMIRCMSQGIVTFLIAYAHRLRAGAERAPTLVFEEIHAAEPTTQEFIALLMRRCSPDVLAVVVSGTRADLLLELEEGLSAAAQHIVSRGPVSEAGPVRTTAELAAAFVDGHGTSDDPAEIEAYERASPAVRTRLHDDRADALEVSAGPSLRIGAITYHREHGSDPGGLGSQTLELAQQYCIEVGFSHAVLDLGMRGRAVTNPDLEQKRYCDFTAAVANALVPLGKVSDSLAFYLELRSRSTLPKVHMTTSYAIAMLHTRFLVPRDHEAAIQWENNAAAIASILPDARERLVFGVFQDNALALIEMHRGNLGHALELVKSGMARLDAELSDDEWVLHRSQLLYNGARLKAALGDTQAAYDDFSTLIEMDPYYTDYLCERAKISRRTGDFAAAIADYDRAAQLAPPFPELYYNRGTAKGELGDVQGAYSDFEYVLEMEPRDADTRLSYAELLVGAGDFTKAMAAVQAGLALVPDEPRLLCMKGTIHLEQAEIQAALDVLDAAVTLDPDYPAALLNRAVAYHEAGQNERSVHDLTRLLDLVGDDPDILLNRGLAYCDLGHDARAAADFARAMALPNADVDELQRQYDACVARPPADRDEALMQ